MRVENPEHVHRTCFVNKWKDKYDRPTTHLGGGVVWRKFVPSSVRECSVEEKIKKNRFSPRPYRSPSVFFLNSGSSSRWHPYGKRLFLANRIIGEFFLFIRERVKRILFLALTVVRFENYMFIHWTSIDRSALITPRIRFGRFISSKI